MATQQSVMLGWHTWDRVNAWRVGEGRLELDQKIPYSVWEAE